MNKHAYQNNYWTSYIVYSQQVSQLQRQRQKSCQDQMLCPCMRCQYSYSYIKHQGRMTRVTDLVLSRRHVYYFYMHLHHSKQHCLTLEPLSILQLSNQRCLVDARILRIGCLSRVQKISKRVTPHDYQGRMTGSQWPLRQNGCW